VTEKLREQILSKARQVDGGADHFMLLEVDRNVSKEQVRAQYFTLAKMYHPDRLTLLKLETLRPLVERIFARLSEAFSVLSDESRRKEYLRILAEGGEAAVRSKEDKEAARAVAILSSEEHFRQGEMALRRQQFPQALEEFKKALDLNPEEGEHHAMFAWAHWCVTADKDKIVGEVKKAFSKALELNPKCVAAFFYLGQIYKHVGDLDRAYNHFAKVLQLQDSHVDARRELRVLEMRRSKSSDKKGGFFDRFKKK
jgi:tetratricopeptide (TPR) repeat protein